MSTHDHRKIRVLWFLDLLLLASCIVLWRKLLGIDLYFHDVYFVPASGQVLLVPWLLLTLPLATATVWALVARRART
jgi:hypothetical protein